MTDIKNDNIGIIHRLSINHRDAVLESEKCGCFYCVTTFPTSEITDWTDNGRTAHCPKCGIDSVIPGAFVEIDGDLLPDMHDRWFRETVDEDKQ